MPKAVSKKPTGSIAKLSKEIKKVARKVKNEGAEIQHLQHRGLISTVARDYTYLNIMDMTIARPIFGTAGADYNLCNKWQHKYIDFDLLLSYGNETSNVDMTAFVVSLKSDAAGIYNPITGTLATLTEGIEYANVNTLPNAGLCYLNPKLFTIHKQKRFAIGNNAAASSGVASGTAGGTYVKNVMRWTFKMKVNKELRNPVGNVASLAGSPSPMTQYYIILFNNNISADFEYPDMTYNIVHTVLVPN